MIIRMPIVCLYGNQSQSLTLSNMLNISILKPILSVVCTAFVERLVCIALTNTHTSKHTIQTTQTWDAYNTHTITARSKVCVLYLRYENTGFAQDMRIMQFCEFCCHCCSFSVSLYCWQLHVFHFFCLYPSVIRDISAVECLWRCRMYWLMLLLLPTSTFCAHIFSVASLFPSFSSESLLVRLTTAFTFLCLFLQWYFESFMNSLRFPGILSFRRGSNVYECLSDA